MKIITSQHYLLKITLLIYNSQQTILNNQLINHLYLSSQTRFTLLIYPVRLSPHNKFGYFTTQLFPFPVSLSCLRMSVKFLCYDGEFLFCDEEFRFCDGESFYLLNEYVELLDDYGDSFRMWEDVQFFAASYPFYAGVQLGYGRGEDQPVYQSRRLGTRLYFRIFFVCYSYRRCALKSKNALEFLVIMSSTLIQPLIILRLFSLYFYSLNLPHKSLIFTEKQSCLFIKKYVFFMPLYN